MNYKAFIAAIGAASIVTGWAASDVAAASAGDFFKGKKITLYIGYSAGGGYDRYARTLSRHMGRFIPGKPRMIPKNLTGAGSIKLANALYHSLPQDGTAIGTIGRGLPAEQLFGRKGPTFDAAKFNWIGSMNNEVSMCVLWNGHGHGVKSFDEAKIRTAVIGGTSQGNESVDITIALNNILGSKFKVVAGYPGGALINLAMERGEVHGRCGWSWSSIKSTRGKWLKDNKLVLLLQMALNKHSDKSISHVPLVMDLVKSKRDKAILRLIFARQAMGRPFVTGPKVPADRVQAMRAAFDAALKDAKFTKDAKKGKLEIEPVSGPEIEKLIAKLFATPKDIVEAAKNATSRLSKTKFTKKKFPWIKATGKITKIKRKGKRLSFKLSDGSKSKAKVSGKKTKITIAGNKAKAKALKKGMSCKIVYKGIGTRAKSLDCN
jgi:tripartite-type tricarboxylate transporter receptor subunit TctC